LPGGGPRAQLPGGGPRAELPGSSPGSPADDSQRVPSWGTGLVPPLSSGGLLDTPRGHEDRESSSLFAQFDERQGPGSGTGQYPAVAGDDRQDPGSTAEMPRIDDRQGLGSTGQFARPDFNAPRPGAGQDPGQYARQDLFASPPAPAQPGYQDPASTGQFTTAGPDSRGPEGTATTGQFSVFDDRRGTSIDDRRGASQDAATGQFAMPGPDIRQDGPQDASSTGQFAWPAFTDRGQQPGGRDTANAGRGPGDTGSFSAPQSDRGRLPMRPAQWAEERDSLPPATGPGDGRTPLYDTLETNWFRGDSASGTRGPQSPASGPRSGGGTPSSPGGFGGTGGPGGFPGTGGPGGPSGSRANGTPAGGHALPDGSAWRTSPNDELVRQAERVRQPSAGGITTSGLPRRVPRANLVAGTAQEQQPQAGPQVSRAPDDVRGRLTNLRRGIQQGRRAGTGSPTGSFPSPTHQQER
jgi:hypothetical protein